MRVDFLHSTKRFFVIILFVFSAQITFAQPGDPGGGDPDVPITGIEILLGIGGALGVKRALNKKKSIR